MAIHTTSISRVTKHDGSYRLLVNVDDDTGEWVTDERAEEIAALRIEQGWRYWRNVRHDDGRIIDVMLTILI